MTEVAGEILAQSPSLMGDQPGPRVLDSAAGIAVSSSSSDKQSQSTQAADGAGPASATPAAVSPPDLQVASTPTNAAAAKEEQTTITLTTASAAQAEEVATTSAMTTTDDDKQLAEGKDPTSMESLPSVEQASPRSVEPAPARSVEPAPPRSVEPPPPRSVDPAPPRSGSARRIDITSKHRDSEEMPGGEGPVLVHTPSVSRMSARSSYDSGSGPLLPKALVPHWNDVQQGALIQKSTAIKYNRDGTAISNIPQRSDGKLSLQEVLSNPSYAVIFNEYCQKAMVLDSVAFLRDVQEYEKLFSWETAYNVTGGKSPAARQQDCGKTVYNMFLRHAAPREVNLPWAMVEKISAKIEEDKFETGLFTEAVHEIHKLIEEDVWMRFQTTTEFNKLEAHRNGKGELPQSKPRPSFHLLHNDLEHFSNLDSVLNQLLSKGHGRKLGWCSRNRVIRGKVLLTDLMALKLAATPAEAQALASRLLDASLLQKHPPPPTRNAGFSAGSFKEEEQYLLVDSASILRHWVSKPPANRADCRPCGEALLKPTVGGAYHKVYMLLHTPSQMLFCFRNDQHTVGHSYFDLKEAKPGSRKSTHGTPKSTSQRISMSLRMKRTMTNEAKHGKVAPSVVFLEHSEAYAISALMNANIASTRRGPRTVKQTQPVFPYYMTLEAPSGLRVFILQDKERFTEMTSVLDAAGLHYVVRPYSPDMID
eukprot:g11017.t1